MDLFADLWLGMSVALTPTNLVFLMIGALVGMVVGIIPGFGPSAGIAILMPLTFGMDPIAAVVMLAAIYYAAMYGGTITSILLNTPGESATVAATFDGYPLAQQGRAGPALVMQAVASFVGGTVGVVLITLLAPLFSQVARGFGPPEYFLLAMMGMLCLVVMVGSDWRYGVISGLIGFALGTVGIDLETGQSRFTFGAAQLAGGSRLDRDAGDDGPVLAAGLCDRRYPGRRRHDRLADGLLGREVCVQGARALRQGRDGGPSRAGDRQQCRVCRRHGAAAHARHPGLGLDRRAAGRLPALGAAPGPAADGPESRVRLGADRQHVPRQRGAGAAQHLRHPAVRPDAAGALPDPGAGRDRALHDRYLQRERQHRRDLDHVHRRHRGLLHEAVRLLAGGRGPRAGAG